MLLGATGELEAFVKREWQTIKEISIVSELSVLDESQVAPADILVSEEVAGLKVAVRPAAGDKCERCWTRSTSVGELQAHPLICDRCAGVVATMDLPVEE